MRKMSRREKWFRRKVLRQSLWEFWGGNAIRMDAMDPITFVNRREALAAKLREAHA